MWFLCKISIEWVPACGGKSRQTSTLEWRNRRDDQCRQSFSPKMTRHKAAVENINDKSGLVARCRLVEQVLVHCSCIAGFHLCNVPAMQTLPRLRHHLLWEDQVLTIRTEMDGWMLDLVDIVEVRVWMGVQMLLINVIWVTELLSSNFIFWTSKSDHIMQYNVLVKSVIR